jgi:hypothetical protein
MSSSSNTSGKVKVSTKVRLPPPEVQGHARPTPLSHTLQQLDETAGGSTGSHISDPIRAELGKLEPQQAAEIRRVAGS